MKIHIGKLKKTEDLENYFFRIKICMGTPVKFQFSLILFSR